MAERLSLSLLTFTDRGETVASTNTCPINHTCIQRSGKTCPYFLGGGLLHNNTSIVCQCPRNYKLDPRLIFYEELSAPWEWPPKPLVNFGSHGLGKATAWAHTTRGPFVLYTNHQAMSYVITTQDPDLVIFTILTEQEHVTPIDPNMPM